MVTADGNVSLSAEANATASRTIGYDNGNFINQNNSKLSLSKLSLSASLEATEGIEGVEQVDFLTPAIPLAGVGIEVGLGEKAEISGSLNFPLSGDGDSLGTDASVDLDWYIGGDYNFIIDGNKTHQFASATWDLLKWPKANTVTFNSNGGSSVAKQTVMSGKTVTSPTAPTKDGYDFEGWYTDSGLTQAYDFSKPVNGDLTLYAKWVADASASGFDFEYHSDGTATVTGGNGGDVVIPSTVVNNGNIYKVTAIGSDAFSRSNGCSYLGSIVIPDSVVSIGDEAFNQDGAYKVTFSKNLKTIGNFAFYGDSLTNIDIPNSVTSIGAGAFAFNQLPKLNLPDGLTSLGDEAFAGNSLTNITLPDSLTSIGREAFSRNSITRMDNVKFDSSLDNLIYSTDYIFDQNKITNLAVPSGVTSIGQGAFSNNPLTDLTLPAGVTNIGTDAFNNDDVTAVTLPDALTNIGAGAFSNNQIKTLTIPSKVVEIGGSSFSGNPMVSLDILDGAPNLTIDEDAFQNDQLASVTLNRVTNIGENSFGGNYLTSLVIPSTVKNVGDGAFQSNELTSLTISNGAKSLGWYAFANNKLTSVVIPKGVSYYSGSTFDSNVTIIQE